MPEQRTAWLIWPMLALTFSTGVVDAVGYLGLDRVFVGNMTGNVVVLGMAVAGADQLPVLGPALAFAAFLVGAAAGGRALRGQPAAWTTRATVLLAVVGLVIAGCAATLLALDVPPASPADPGPRWLLAATCSLAAVMGLQAAVARTLAVKDVTTVVVTSTMTALAAESRLGAASGGTAWRRRAGAITLIALGALAGAALLKVHLGAGLGLAALLVLGTAVGGHLGARRLELRAR
ncbi:YoaK family protein [Modestobacter sp. NPDC049651]|uniref:YoaK family protein n=1 Tax=unclassified Modestobacter TaxID=2643866 RepID=UPI0033E85487